MENQDGKLITVIGQGPTCDAATGVCLPEGETAAVQAGRFALPAQTEDRTGDVDE